MNTKIIALIAIAALGLLLVTAAMTTTNVFAGVITTVITTATIVAGATARVSSVKRL